MGKIDDILQAAVNKQAEPQEEKAEPEATVEKKTKKKVETPVEEPQEPEKKVEVTPKRKIPVKAYGKEKELEIGDDEIPTYVQKGYAAEEKWKESQAALRKAEEIEERNNELIESLKKDPEKALELILGQKNLDAISEKRLMRQFEMEKMSPEQRELAQINERIAAAKKEEDEIKAKRSKAEKEEKEAYFDNQFKDMTMKALSKIGLEKPTKKEINRFLMEIRPYLSNTDKMVTEEDMDILANYFKKNMDKEDNEHFDTMTGEQIAAKLGKANVEKVRKFLMNGFTKPASPPKTEVKKPASEKGSLREYFKNL